VTSYVDGTACVLAVDMSLWKIRKRRTYFYLKAQIKFCPNFLQFPSDLDEVPYSRFSCNAVKHLTYYSTIFSPSVSFAILRPFYILFTIFSFGFPTYNFLCMKIYELPHFCCVNTASRFLISCLLRFIYLQQFVVLLLKCLCVYCHFFRTIFLLNNFKNSQFSKNQLQ
jgi:hypothetical protein